MVHCSLNDLEPMYTRRAPEPVGRPRRPLRAGAHARDAGVLLRRPRSRPCPVLPRTTCLRRPAPTLADGTVVGAASGAGRGCGAASIRLPVSPPWVRELTSSWRVITWAKTTFGEGTPFAVMAEHRTAIVGIGTEYFRCLTQVHAAEDLLGERYPLALRATTVPVELKDVDGTTHNYDLRLDEHGMGRRLERLEQLLGSDELVQWRFHGVPLFVTSASPRDRGADRGGAARGDDLRAPCRSAPGIRAR